MRNSFRKIVGYDRHGKVLAALPVCSELRLIREVNKNFLGWTELQCDIGCSILTCSPSDNRDMCPDGVVSIGNRIDTGLRCMAHTCSQPVVRSPQIAPRTRNPIAPRANLVECVRKTRILHPRQQTSSNITSCENTKVSSLPTMTKVRPPNCFRQLKRWIQENRAGKYRYRPRKNLTDFVVSQIDLYDSNCRCHPFGYTNWLVGRRIRRSLLHVQGEGY